MNTPKSNVVIRTLLTLAVLAAFIYFYPRILVGWLGDANPWTSYLYLYGFGFVFWLAGMILITRTGACKLGRGHDTFWFKILIGGLIFFMALHAVWILASLKIPFLGDA